MWIDCSRLVYGKGLPDGAWGFAMFFAAVFSVTTVLRGWVLKDTAAAPWIPGGVCGRGMWGGLATTMRQRYIGGRLRMRGWMRGWSRWQGVTASSR